MDSAATQSGLAATGVPVLQMVGLALATVIGGVGLLLAARNRRRTAAD